MLESLHRQCPAAGSKSLALWRRTIRCFEQRNLAYIPDMQSSEIRVVPNWFDQIRQRVRPGEL